jgi:GNAT superfamily N-acetyltransferase
VSDRLEPLADAHDLDSFDCGDRGLSDWLEDHGRHATRQGTRTYVLAEHASNSVIGYFAVAPFLVEREQTPRRIGRGAPSRIPAILLAKLALDRRLHGEGLGAELLVHALTTILRAARAAGGRLVVVDAVDDRAAAFYEAHDFEPLPDHPHRLAMKLSTAARALDVPWP